MANVIDYVSTRLDTFEQRAFCAVDSLALSFFAYIAVPGELDAALTWEGMRIGDLYRAEHFAHYYAGLWAERSGLELLIAMAASPRFRDIRLARYVEKIDQKSEMQFSAMTFLLPDGSAYVAFKGTDATFVGWKEDFNLSFQCPVPSQTEAVAYLTEAATQTAMVAVAPATEIIESPEIPIPLGNESASVANAAAQVTRAARATGEAAQDTSAQLARASRPTSRVIRVGGHSKGGNLAIYAAATCDDTTQTCIERVYSHDGPGFFPEFMASPGYRTIADRIDKTIPQSSVVGMLMEEGTYSVVESNGKGFWQHDPSTWQINLLTCDFVHAKGLTADARYADATISTWVRTRTRQEREMFVNALYAVIEGADADTLNDFRNDWRHALPAVARALYEMDAETKSFTAQTISDLLVIGAKSVPETITATAKAVPEKLGVLESPAVKNILETKDLLAPKKH